MRPCSVEPSGNAIFDLYGSQQHTVPCPVGSLVRVGSGEDGGKLVCLDAVVAGKQNCTVYSLGSNGQFDFEESILKQTNCTVHTFDCTSAPKQLDPARHQYHEIWCARRALARRGTMCVRKSNPQLPPASCSLGKSTVTTNDSKQFMSFQDLTTSLGHQAVDLLKMDIEVSLWRPCHCHAPSLPN